MKALVFHDEEQGSRYDTVEIPTELADAGRTRRARS